ncbi:TPA: hypothetical protein ACN37M_005192, partial [Vibrio parahaemolyticus]
AEISSAIKRIAGRFYCPSMLLYQTTSTGYKKQVEVIWVYPLSKTVRGNEKNVLGQFASN